MAHVRLAFGQKFFEFDIRDQHVLDILKPRRANPTKPPKKSFEVALASPIASKPLREIIDRPGQTVIVAPDKTRNCGAPILLPMLLDHLNVCGVSDRDVNVLLALGSHVPHTDGEIEQIVGNEVVNRVKVIEHDCQNELDLVYLGETTHGTPVFINRNIVEAEFVIVVSTAVHHYFAGYGGGWKMINPGCAGYETIRKNHALTIDENSGAIQPKCRSGVLTGNPVQEDLRESLRFLKVDYLVETIVNDAGEIVEIMSGDLFAAHEQACALVDSFYKIPVKEQADLVVVSCGGHPKDINMIQAHKSLHNAFQAVKEGGVILMLAECSQGVGSNTFLDWFDLSDEPTFLNELKHNYTLNGTTALSVRMKAKAANIILISKLPNDVVARMGITSAASLDEGWRIAQSQLDENFKCCIIPNGSLTLPFRDAYES
ncbi:nickel-dependent lactate racemase [candidate division KSB1 bacterium]|nr:nickel-dependent lactate racemase [candidate division KSB1 bacterium]NIR73261.1 nickel-dependent lactate racemase [candidate division KSB1 bacterium]NIS26967.1 nickel-dependent lactate racemase [candidate division KSB1 bacterium]NIT73806.1 nickel-dependent lactate racemase [candidate division KSB1 bacterium]NIU27711.1 nickel-dependent lactate racemase [candidate division KSB1 bacterium]